MGASEIRWLLKELPGLVERGVIEPGVATRVRSHYETEADRRRGASPLVVVFGALGAILVAAGVLLLLAHNWDDLSTATRVALAFAPLVAAQAVAGWVRLRRSGSAAWREGSAAFLALSAGGCLALTGQIYHLPFALDELLLTWSLLALPVLYLLESRLVLTLYCIGVTAWLYAGYAELVPPQRFAGYGLLVLAGVPALVRSARSRRDGPSFALPAWLVLTSLVAGTFRIAWGAPLWAWVVLCAGLFGAMHGLGSGAGSGTGAESHFRRASKWLGALGVGAGVVVLSYRDAWTGLIDSLREQIFVRGAVDLRLFTTWTTLGLGLALVALAVPAGMRRIRDGGWHEGATALVILPVVAGMVLGLPSGRYTASVLLINVYGIALGLLACREGLRSGRLASANFGLLLVSAVLVARFFDVDWSFVVRGVGFVVLGILFLTMNLAMLARRKEATA